MAGQIAPSPGITFIKGGTRGVMINNLIFDPCQWAIHYNLMTEEWGDHAVLHNVGARPWDRDYDDVRLIAGVAEGRGKIIDSQDDIHGYPVQHQIHRAFNPADWYLGGMTPKSPAVLGSSNKAHGT